MSTALPSLDPSDIANAARCFASCIPPGLHLPLRSFTINQIGVTATDPVCKTPGAPSIAKAQTQSDTSIQIIWKANPHNTGSFITGWIVNWGTTSGGPYPNSSGVLPLVPRLYVATGLTPGTTYYFTVTAVTAIPGCTSAASPQASATTTGAPAGNGLLNSLISYWKADTFNASTMIDSVSGINPQATNGGQDMSLSAGGIINSCIACNGANGINAILLNPPNFIQLLAGPGVPLSISMWINLGAAQVSATTAFISATGNTVFYSLQFSKATGKFTWIYYDSTATPVNLAYTIAPSTNAWHHYAFGVDTANAQLFFWLDAANKQTIGIPNGPRATTTNFTFAFMNQVVAIGDPVGSIDEIALWNGKALTQTDVTNLYNGGAGLPLSSFTT